MVILWARTVKNLSLGRGKAEEGKSGETKSCTNAVVVTGSDWNVVKVYGNIAVYSLLSSWVHLHIFGERGARFCTKLVTN